MLANQVGIAIDHARLYEAIQETFLENAEANKMLGLTFQSKGMLELALERFLRVPLGDEMLEILYHLAWDFERIRNAQKAREVYETIAAKAPGFRDVQGRLKALADPSQAVAGRSSLLRVPAAGQGGAAARQRGAAVGRYEILSELGRGSLGRVYKGRDPRLQRLVALKVLEWEGDVAPEEQQELTRLFLQEVESAGKLNHPGIVVIFDAGEHMGTPYMAMELLEGAPLDRWLCKAKPMPVHHVLHVGLQVSQALSHAHDGGVLHGGIKPSNVFLMPKGRVKVTDFGTASIAARIHAAAEADGRSNQPAYLSPEVVLGEPLDARSDLYSLGALLYAILTGKPPFSDEQVEALMEQIIIRRAVPVRQLNAGVPAPVAALVDRMMSKEPEARFASAGEVAEAIERLLKG
jgi:serine/threonine-protein kinase